MGLMKQGWSLAVCGVMGVALLSVAAIAANPHASLAGGEETSAHYIGSARAVSVMLPDGRQLAVYDGQGGGHLSDAMGIERIALPEARRDASVTVMPSGQVLIWGGTDAKGQVLDYGQWFDPATRQFVRAANLGLPARAGHTLTVLSDGHLLLAGGWTGHDVPTPQALVWDVLHRQVTPVAGVDVTRYRARARMEANGAIRIEGGVDARGFAVRTAAWYVPDAQKLVSTEAASNGNTVAPVTALPGAEATDAPLRGPLSLRFAQPVNLRELATGKAVKLLGPNGTIDTKIVGVEGGRLAFVQLPDDLYPGARYTLFVQGLHTASGQAVPYTAVGFTTTTIRTEGVSLAGQGGRNTGLSANGESTPVEPAQVLMAGTGKDVCASKDPNSLCRERGTMHDGAWYPGQDNAPDTTGGHWRLYHGRQELPDTRVQEAHLAKNATALVGQVRRIDESPVANVEISIGERKVRTDAQGVFVLEGLSEGRQELFVDGRTASRGELEYGRFLVGADIKAGQHNRMPFVMYLPRVLARDKIRIPSPTTREVVLTHPEMPGLELHIPAGTVFKDREGNVLTELAVVPTPVDHAPFPLPANFPMYFTIQPGDAVVQGLNAEAAKGIQVVYPNYGKQPPQKSADFWVYNVKSGWQMYGGGHVTADAKHLAPDPGVSLVWALGAGASIDNSKKPGDMTCGNKTAGEPIDLQTGNFFHEWVDLKINDVIPIAVMRAQNNQANSVFGYGSGFNYGMNLYSPNGYDSIWLVMPCSQGIKFDLISGSTTWPFTPATFWKHTATNSAFYGATLQYLFDNTDVGAHWVVSLKDGTQYWFDRHVPNNLELIQDRFGNKVQFVYNGGLLEQVISPSGRTIDFDYGANNFITSATDNTGRTVGYEYTNLNEQTTGMRTSLLTKVTYPDQTTEEYTYVKFGDTANSFMPLIETMKDRRGTIWVTNEYDDRYRVKTQTYADGTSYKFEYTPGPDGIVATKVTDPAGNQEYVTFDPVSKYPSSETLAYGTALAQTTTYQRLASGLVSKVTDALGRATSYTYSDTGNVTSVTFLAGTSNAVTYGFTYTSDYNQIASVTDPLNHTTTFTYSNGCLAQIADPLGHGATLLCNGAGQVTAIENALGHLTVLSYQGYDLRAVTDAIGRTVTFTIDALGRRTSTTAPDGTVTLAKFDVNDRVAQVIDGLGQITKVDYDGNGNPTAVTLPNGKVMANTFDNRNRLTLRKDPLGQSESWTYDGMNHLLSRTDRKQQTTLYTYDALGRHKLTTYADSSGTQATYDSGNRLTELLDTNTGSLSWGYDDLNRVTQEVTPQGTVSYGYDAASRRTSMTPASQGVVTYQYDNANRLLSISQGSEVVQLDYDDSGRRTGVTLPNGILMAYGYDDASQLTGIVYTQRNGTKLGDLTYGHDVAGQTVAQGGSLAFNQLPTPTTQASTFDDNNRQTGFNGAALTYDANGNLTGDGVNSFVWNARDQLVQIQQGGVSQLSFAYDALGRRVSKAVGGSTPTQYLYDGYNAIQETQGAAVNPILTGLGIDERFARNDVSGRTYFMTDMLGSTIGLTDGSGAIQQRYTYDAYGNVTPADTSTGFTNPYQFTGREADTGGLYYYRARYYSPGMGRFISEDPVGFAGGQNNFYGYVDGNPTNYRDPSGLFLTSVDAVCMQAPQFCAEIFGDIARSEGTILSKLGAPCAEQAGEAVGNLFDTLGKMAMIAPAAGIAGGAAKGTVRVGRWMSEAELTAMQQSGRVVESRLNGVTSVTSPPNAMKWLTQTEGTHFVEFSIPKDALRATDGVTGKIFGPNSIFGPKLGITEMPAATDIVHTATKLP